MMKKIILLVTSFILSCNIMKGNDKDLTPIPTPAQVTWQNSELVALVSYDLHVNDDSKYIQKENRISPISNMNIFAPKFYDTDQWIRSIKGMGAKIAVLTVTHETGFALYQSDVNPYCMKALKWRNGQGDIVRDFVNSCRKYGILPGLYIGIRWNSFLGVYDFKVTDDGSEFAKRRQKFYNKMCEGMTEELVSRYGELAMLWYDGGASGPDQGGPDILPIVEKYQKNIVFYRNSQRSDLRWAGNEDGRVNYPCWGNYPCHTTLYITLPKGLPSSTLRDGCPDGKYYIPAMADIPLRGYNGGHEWFWDPNQEHYIYPLQELMDRYKESVGRNATLVVGVTPDNRGLIPSADSLRMAEFGKEIDFQYGSNINSVKGNGYKFTLSLKKATQLSNIIIQEDIRYGERIRKFELEGKTTKGRWIKLAEKSCIGHKYIEHINSPEKFNAIRLIIKEAVAEPIILNFSVR